jgi:hypothetical protein
LIRLNKSLFCAFLSFDMCDSRDSSASLFIHHQTDEWVRENEKETTIKITPSLLLGVSAIEILVYLFGRYMRIETYIYTHICDSLTRIALS